MLNNTLVRKMDSSKIYSMPLLSKMPSSDVMLTWTEKDAQGMVALCLAISKDQGKSFAEKKTVYSGSGIGTSASRYSAMWRAGLA